MSNVNLQSTNFPDHFIRHSNFRGVLTTRGGPVLDFAFAIIGYGDHLVSLRSANFPDRFLRHRDFEIHLDPVTNDDQFRQDSTFRVVSGLSNPDGVSFESINFPGRYVRHRDFLLWLEGPTGPGDDLFRHDATFLQRPAAVLLDDQN